MGGERGQTHLLGVWREVGRLSDLKLQGNVTVVKTDLFLLLMMFQLMSLKYARMK
jgi:hypothetical protein